MRIINCKSWIVALFSIVCVSGSAILAQDAKQDAKQDAEQASLTQKPGVRAQETSIASDLAQAFRTIAQQVSPSVVSIRVTRDVQAPQSQLPDDFLRRFFDDLGPDQNRRPGANPRPESRDENDDQDVPPGSNQRGTMRQIGTGSGVIVQTEGSTAYILTNNHVAGHASDMEIRLSDGRVIKDAKLVGADAATDLAVVQVQMSGLTAVQWGDSDQLKQGDWVLAFGAPFGYVGSMSHGIVSALHRQAGILGAGGYESFIQTDASINPGNSGGPLVDMQGRIIGVNTAIASASGGSQGIGFAVPSSMARPVYQELKANGKVTRGWLGLQIVNVADAPDQAKSLGYTDATGVMVRSVLSDSPASGTLRPGDVITSLNGRPVTDASELRNAIALAPPGKEVKLGIVRDGKEQEVSVKIGTQLDNAQVAAGRGEENPQTADLGMRLSDVTEQLAKRYNLNDASSGGALVTRVTPGSAAANAGVKVGDVITRINEQDIANVNDARDALSKADVKKGVRLYIKNAQGTEYLFVRSTK